MPILVVIIGPIASGTSTLTNELRSRFRKAGRSVSVLDLDEVADTIGGSDDLSPERSRHAQVVFGKLVRAWLAEGFDVVAHGLPLQTHEHDVVVGALPEGVELHLVRLNDTADDTTTDVRALVDDLTAKLLERSAADRGSSARRTPHAAPVPDGDITYAWRGPFTNREIHPVHAAAFETRLFDESEWDWVDQTERFSLGWVVARDGERFVGFVNVLWDGLVHAFIEDVMVDADYRRRGIGVGLVHAARDGAQAAGCEFLHVGFDDDLRAFYIDACGFESVPGGLIELA